MKATWDGEHDLFDLELSLTLGSEAFADLRELRYVEGED